MRATFSTVRSEAAGFRKRRYRSCDSDVVSMNNAASAALTSAENSAASASDPTSGGRSCTSSIGSASSRSVEARMQHARDHAEQDRDDRVGQQAQRVQADADAHGAIVSRAVDLLQQSRRHDERRARGTRCTSSRTGRSGRNSSSRPAASPRAGRTVRRPALSAIGSAMKKPSIFTASCTMLTHAVDFNPPAAE